MTFTTLTLNTQDQITRLSLARPDKHNAFNATMIKELQQAFELVAKNTDQSRVLILQATGPSFCAGADLGWMREAAGYSHAQNLADAKQLGKLFASLHNLPIPTIAQVQGQAFGGGVGLVACCDIAIGSDKARFALSEVRLGLSPATISPYVIAAIGPRWAKRLFLTGERISAQTALQIGLLHSLHAPEDLDQACTELCQSLRSGGPHAQAAIKELVTTCQTHPETIHNLTPELIAKRRASPEAQAGMAAFFDKKPTPWTIA